MMSLIQFVRGSIYADGFTNIVLVADVVQVHAFAVNPEAMTKFKQYWGSLF